MATLPLKCQLEERRTSPRPRGGLSSAAEEHSKSVRVAFGLSLTRLTSVLLAGGRWTSLQEESRRLHVGLFANDEPPDT